MSYSVNYWDSAEFSSSNYMLTATHPAGAPFYTLLMNVVLLFFPSSAVGVISTFFSALFSSITLIFVSDIIYLLGQKIIPHKNTSLHLTIASILGSLSLAFSISYWTSSTETEVYTLSFLLLTICFWIGIIKTNTINKQQQYKLTFLLYFLLGISIGIHPINIAIIIPIQLLNNSKNIVISLLKGFLIFILLQNIAFKKYIALLAKIDIHTVNHWDWPVNFGALTGFVLLIVLIFSLLYFLKRKALVQLILGCWLFFIIGFSAYITPLIRTNQKAQSGYQITTVGELLSYVNAEQFGIHNIPILYGKTFSAPLNYKQAFVSGSKIYYYDTSQKKYILSNNGTYNNKNYAKEFYQFFPRMYSEKATDISGYHKWIKIKGNSIPYTKNGSIHKIIKPTFSENLSFFFNYQLYYSNIRYLLWNFVGKQNNHHSTGTIEHGNWQSGFYIIDKAIVGEFYNSPHKVVYYGIPFLLGILGLVTLFFTHKPFFYTTFVLFILMGTGITIYVNPTPSSLLIRERDYIIIGSFIVFSWWIGLSYLGLVKLLKTNTKITYTVAAILIVICPIHLLAKNISIANRSNDNFNEQIAEAYLTSCPKNAILFTVGDNAFFPLEYLQNIKKIRTDVTVVNTEMLVQPWYIEQLKHKITIDVSNDHYQKGYEMHLPIIHQKENIQDKTLFKFISNPKNDTLWNGYPQSYIPSTKMLLSTKNWSDYIELEVPTDTLKTINVSFDKQFLAKNELIFWNIISNAQQPIAFTLLNSNKHFKGLQKLTIQKGLVAVLSNKYATKNYNPKLIDTYTGLSLFKKLHYPANTFNTYENRNYIKKIIRPQLYYLIQNLIEKEDLKNATQLLDNHFKITNSQVPYQTYAFSLAKLYIKSNKSKKGLAIITTILNNYQTRIIKYLDSQNIPNSLINSKKFRTVANHYREMILQLKNINYPLYIKHNLFWEKHQQQMNTWYIKYSSR